MFDEGEIEVEVGVSFLCCCCIVNDVCEFVMVYQDSLVIVFMLCEVVYVSCCML